MTDTFAVAVSRTISAPRAEVYRAFLDPELLARWMCPGEMAVVTATVDERVGGRHVVDMLWADGTRLAFESVIRELVPQQRLVLELTFVGAGHPPDATRFTATFRDAGEHATEVRLEHERVPLVPPMDPGSVDEGWTSVLDKLQALYARS